MLWTLIQSFHTITDEIKTKWKRRDVGSRGIQLQYLLLIGRIFYRLINRSINPSRVAIFVLLFLQIVLVLRIVVN